MSTGRSCLEALGTVRPPVGAEVDDLELVDVHPPDSATAALDVLDLKYQTLSHNKSSNDDLKNLTSDKYALSLTDTAVVALVIAAAVHAATGPRASGGPSRPPPRCSDGLLGAST